MEDAARIPEQANDLAAIIDPIGFGKRGAWEIDLGEGQFIVMALLFAAGFLGSKANRWADQQSESERM
jgi:hypothetical protein